MHCALLGRLCIPQELAQENLGFELTSHVSCPKHLDRHPRPLEEIPVQSAKLEAHKMDGDSQFLRQGQHKETYANMINPKIYAFKINSQFRMQLSDRQNERTPKWNSVSGFAFQKNPWLALFNLSSQQTLPPAHRRKVNPHKTGSHAADSYGRTKRHRNTCMQKLPFCHYI